VQAKHLVPCSSCGGQVPVGRQQAGETVRCQCGASLEVPTLLKLTKLPSAQDPDVSAEIQAGFWGLRQRLILAGLVIAILALVPAVILMLTFPERPEKQFMDPNEIRKRSEGFTATESLLVWRDLARTGVNHLWVEDQLGYKDAVIRYEEKRLNYQIGIVVFFVFCCLGIALTVVGARMKPPERQ